MNKERATGQEKQGVSDRAEKLKEMMARGGRKGNRYVFSSEFFFAFYSTDNRLQTDNHI
jgi:hypothetical protein